jgi:hypothetical protein
MCRIRTLRKIPPWVKVSYHEGKSATRLGFKECFEGSVNRNMKLELGQRCKDETCDVIKYEQQESFHVKFYEPREGKISGFSHLESLKNTKRRLQSVPFS